MAFGAGRKVLAVIPARFASIRFPGKVIALLASKSLVIHAYEHALATSRMPQMTAGATSNCMFPGGISRYVTRGHRIPRLETSNNSQRASGVSQNVGISLLPEKCRGRQVLAVAGTDYGGIGVDTPEDMRKVAALLKIAEKGEG